MSGKNVLAPVVLFVYNRPLHTRKTVEALRRNPLAVESDLHIFSDNSNDESVVKNVNQVRKYIKQIEGFKKIKIHHRDRNWGLAGNIIDGVTKIVKEYGTVIVLEDDCVTSPYYLDFMNGALSFYKDDERVWHISGWNYPIQNDGIKDTFLWRVMNCWGWATWADRWSLFEKDTDKIIRKFSKKDIKRFNLDGTANFWKQLLANKLGQMNTWAVYWYATIYLNGGLCLNPVQTFVDNIGIDGSGQHCWNTKSYSDNLNVKMKVTFEKKIIESDKYVRLIKRVIRKSFYLNVKNLLLWK